MKKIFLNLFLMVSVVAFTACGSDDDATTPPVGVTGGTLVVDIDGVTTTFNTLTINSYVSSGEPAIELTASIDGGANKLVEIAAYNVGANAIYDLKYTENGVVKYHYHIATGIPGITHASNVTEHTASKFVASFTGSIFDTMTGTTTFSLENGSISATF